MTPLPNNVIEGICHSSHGMEGSSHSHCETDDSKLNLYSENDRLRTFSNWPTIPLVNKCDLAAAGFYYVNYVNKNNLVKCAYCGLEVSNFEDGNNPYELHRKNSPHCHFILQSKAESSSSYGVSNFDTCGAFSENRRRQSISEAERIARERALREIRINETEIPSFPTLVSQEERLKTYERWPVNFKLRPNVLSEAGFYYGGSGVRTVCFQCGGCLSWDKYDDPFSEHAHWFPKCHYIKSYSANKPTEESNDTKKSSYASPPTRQSPSRNLHYDLLSDRLKTFTLWPVSFIDKNELAEAGFIYTNCGDRVHCYYCDLELCNWENGDDPANEHLKHSPNCTQAPHLRAMILRKTGSSQINANDNGYDTCGPYDVVNRRPPAYPEYATLANRVNSFANWPVTSKLPASALWEVGFFYLEIDDQTICYQCGGGLKDWKEHDDPWVEHAHWFPQCQFVLSKKGSAFIYEACLKKRETLALTQEEIKTAIDTLKEVIRTNINSPDVNIGNAKENKGCANGENMESHDDEKPRMLCKICFLEEWNTLFYQCGHMACSKCANAIQNCAFCRKPIIDRVQMYCS